MIKTKAKTCVGKTVDITSETELQMWRGEHGSQGDGLLPPLHGGCGEGGGREVRIVGIVNKKSNKLNYEKVELATEFLLCPTLFLRCDEIYREFTRSDMSRHESSERRIVVITSLESKADQGARGEIKLGETERKREVRKCDRIFLSSAPIKAEMVPFQGLQGDQVP